ncbi:MAG: prolyl oligopeptidase family serine peptidase [Salinibacter sp.]
MPSASSLRHWAAVGVGLLLLGLSPVQGQSPSDDPPPLQASDLFKMQTIEDVVISPNGRSTAYTVRRAVSDGQSVQTQLYVAPLSGRSRPRQLTRAPQGATAPTWDPDGNRIAFVRPVNGTPQLFVLSLSGGEPYQLTDTPYGATQPAWGPQGNHILFRSAIPASALQRRSTRARAASRPGHGPQATTRSITTDTLHVLRHERTLDPVDTLALGPQGPAVPGDSARPLRAPGGPEQLRTLSSDSLRTLSSDSLRSVLDALRLRPDTTQTPIRSDTAAAPDGDLLQRRRWLERSRPDAPSVYAGTAFPGESNPTYDHYFVVDAPDARDRGTPSPSSARPVTQGDRSFSDAAWLSNGSQIVVSGPLPANGDDSDAHALYVADVDKSRLQRLLTIDGLSLHAPRPTSDGTTIAFQARATDAPSYAQTQIGLFALDGRSDPRVITEDVDRDIQSLQWSPDGWYLYATAQSGTGRPLYRFSPFASPDTSAAEGDRSDEASLDTDRSASRDTFTLDASMVRTASHEQMTDSTRWIRAVDATDAVAVYAATQAESPSELYANTVNFSNERRLSNHNDWLEDRTQAPTTSRSVSNDTLSVPGRLTRPPSARDSARAPLVVVPRGGPSALARPSPAYAWFERQYLAAQGLAVVEAWPRGSTGNGQAYRRANNRDWGPGPFADLQAMADSASNRSWVDGGERALVGHGYGASLALWGLGHHDMYRAAVAQSGVYTLPSLLNHRATAALLPDQFGGGPWDGPSPSALARDSVLPDTATVPSDTTLSPRTALYRSAPLSRVEEIRTPLLLTQGAASAPVPGASAATAYSRLRALERPVEYAQYPGPGTPLQQRDRLVRLHEFLARFLPDSPAPADASEE